MAILAHTDPGTAGFLLAEQLTRLPAGHIELIGRDQITAERILGSPAPERARAVLQALTAGGYNLTSPRERRTPPARPPLEHGAGSAFERNEFTTTLGWLLETRRNVAHATDTTTETRVLLDELCSHDILEQTQGVYCASHITLYSTYAHPLAPIIH